MVFILGYDLHMCWSLSFINLELKWVPREKGGSHMGYSCLYLSMVGLVLNLRNVSITPQYHVMYDDMLRPVHINENSYWPEE